MIDLKTWLLVDVGLGEISADRVMRAAKVALSGTHNGQLSVADFLSCTNLSAVLSEVELDEVEVQSFLLAVGSWSGKPIGVSTDVVVVRSLQAAIIACRLQCVLKKQKVTFTSEVGTPTGELQRLREAALKGDINQVLAHIPIMLQPTSPGASSSAETDVVSTEWLFRTTIDVISREPLPNQTYFNHSPHKHRFLDLLTASIYSRFQYPRMTSLALEAAVSLVSNHKPNQMYLCSNTDLLRSYVLLLQHLSDDDYKHIALALKFLEHVATSSADQMVRADSVHVIETVVAVFDRLSDNTDDTLVIATTVLSNILLSATTLQLQASILQIIQRVGLCSTLLRHLRTHAPHEPAFTESALYLLYLFLAKCHVLPDQGNGLVETLLSLKVDVLLVEIMDQYIAFSSSIVATIVHICAELTAHSVVHHPSCLLGAGTLLNLSTTSATSSSSGSQVTGKGDNTSTFTACTRVWTWLQQRSVDDSEVAAHYLRYLYHLYLHYAPEKQRHIDQMKRWEERSEIPVRASLYRIDQGAHSSSPNLPLVYEHQGYTSPDRTTIELRRRLISSSSSVTSMTSGREESFLSDSAPYQITPYSNNMLVMAPTADSNVRQQPQVHAGSAYQRKALMLKQEALHLLKETNSSELLPSILSLMLKFHAQSAVAAETGLRLLHLLGGNAYSAWSTLAHHGALDLVFDVLCVHGHRSSAPATGANEANGEEDEAVLVSIAEAACDILHTFYQVHQQKATTVASSREPQQTDPAVYVANACRQILRIRIRQTPALDILVKHAIAPHGSLCVDNSLLVDRDDAPQADRGNGDGNHDGDMAREREQQEKDQLRRKKRLQRQQQRLRIVRQGVAVFRLVAAYRSGGDHTDGNAESDASMGTTVKETTDSMACAACLQLLEARWKSLRQQPRNASQDRRTNQSTSTSSMRDAVVYRDQQEAVSITLHWLHALLLSSYDNVQQLIQANAASLLTQLVSCYSLPWTVDVPDAGKTSTMHKTPTIANSGISKDKADEKKDEVNEKGTDDVDGGQVEVIQLLLRLIVAFCQVKVPRKRRKHRRPRLDAIMTSATDDECHRPTSSASSGPEDNNANTAPGSDTEADDQQQHQRPSQSAATALPPAQLALLQCLHNDFLTTLITSLVPQWATHHPHLATCLLSLMGIFGGYSEFYRENKTQAALSVDEKSLHRSMEDEDRFSVTETRACVLVDEVLRHYIARYVEQEQQRHLRSTLIQQYQWQAQQAREQAAARSCYSDMLAVSASSDAVTVPNEVLASILGPADDANKEISAEEVSEVIAQGAKTITRLSYRHMGRTKVFLTCGTLELLQKVMRTAWVGTLTKVDVKDTINVLRFGSK